MRRGRVVHSVHGRRCGAAGIGGPPFVDRGALPDSRHMRAVAQAAERLVHEFEELRQSDFSNNRPS